MTKVAVYCKYILTIIKEWCYLYWVLSSPLLYHYKSFIFRRSSETEKRSPPLFGRWWRPSQKTLFPVSSLPNWTPFLESSISKYLLVQFDRCWSFGKIVGGKTFSTERLKVTKLLFTLLNKTLSFNKIVKMCYFKFRYELSLLQASDKWSLFLLFFIILFIPSL